jgi:hypothetical protein
MSFTSCQMSSAIRLCGHDLLKTLEQNIGVLLLEDQHRPETDCLSTRATDVDADGLGLLQDLVALRRVPGDEGPLALATEVLDLLGELGGKTLEAGVEVSTSLGGVLHEVLAFDLGEDSAEEDGTGGVTEPAMEMLASIRQRWYTQTELNLRVELAVCLVGTELRVAVVVTSSLSLLGEGDHVRRVLEVPVVVSPELAGGADTSLDLVDNHEDVVLAGDGAEAPEESRRRVVVTALGLDRLDNDGGGWAVEGRDDVLNLLEAALLLTSVLLGMLLKRILELREGSLWPVKGGNIELVNGLGASAGERSKETAVEATTEGQDGHVGRAGCLVVHRGLDVLLRELGVICSTLLLSLPHESCLHGQLVGIGAGSRSEDLVEALGQSTQKTSFEDFGPVVGGEVAHGGTVDQGRHHLRAHGRLKEGRVAVANRDRGDLGVDVEQDVAVEVGDIVAEGVLVVAHHVQAPGLVDLVQLGNSLLSLGARNLSPYDRSSRLVGEQWLLNGIGDGLRGGGGSTRRALGSHAAGEGCTSVGTQNRLQPSY